MDEWLAGLTNRNAADDRSRVMIDVRPVWQDVSVLEAQRLQGVMRWLSAMRKSELSGQSQRHALNAFSRFMAWAVEQGYAEVNPVRMVPQGKRPQAASKQADAPWLRDEDTFRKILAALLSPVSLMFWLGNASTHGMYANHSPQRSEERRSASRGGATTCDANSGGVMRQGRLVASCRNVRRKGRAAECKGLTLDASGGARQQWPE